MKLFELFEHSVLSSAKTLNTIAEAARAGTGATVMVGMDTYTISARDARYINKLYEAAIQNGTEQQFLKGLNEKIIVENEETLSHVLKRFPKEVKDFKAGAELDNDLYEALYDYYMLHGEMPYGVAKARDGDPFQWVSDRLGEALGTLPFSGGHPAPAVHKDQFGNVIKPENMARHLAKKGMAGVGEAVRVAGAFGSGDELKHYPSKTMAGKSDYAKRTGENPHSDEFQQHRDRLAAAVKNLRKDPKKKKELGRGWSVSGGNDFTAMKYDSLTKEGVAEGPLDNVDPDEIVSMIDNELEMGNHYEGAVISVSDELDMDPSEVDNIYRKNTPDSDAIPPIDFGLDEGVAAAQDENKEPLFVAISADKREQFEDWMDSEGFNVPEPKQEGNYFVYDYTNEDVLAQSYAEEWNEAVDDDEYDWSDEEFDHDRPDLHEAIDMKLLRSMKGAMAGNVKDPESERNIGKKYGYRSDRDDSDEDEDEDFTGKKKAKDKKQTGEKRGRGRPRKHPKPDPNAPKKTRGRPRKHPKPDPNAPKRPRGRPRKVREWIETLRYLAVSPSQNKK